MNRVIITALTLTAALIISSCGKDKGKAGKIIKTKSGIDVIFIKGGEFIMGGDEKDQSPLHKVKLSSFYMDRGEVTQGMYDKLELPHASHFKGKKRPAEMVSWVNAAIYCNERSIEEGLKPCYNEETWECDFTADGYRLPTEAEWEYAARGGSKSKYFFGNTSKNLKNYAVYKKNSQGRTADTGTRKPNSLGLTDIYGNVSEWCNDYYAPDYYRKSAVENPRGPKKGNARVIRGGSWNDDADSIGSSVRGRDDSINDACILRDTIGFRCVRRAD